MIWLIGNKPAFNYSSLHNTSTNNDVASPFWVKPKSKSSKFLSVLLKIWKYTKILILLFFFTMGLWGCFQSSFDPLVASSTSVGSGLEFGFNFGTTGDWKYDLVSSPLQQYHTFNQWSMDYGPFYAFFVWPGAWLTMQICWGSHTVWGGLNALVAIFVLILIIRVFTILTTIKSAIQNEKMSEVNGKLAEINAKYKGLKDTNSKQLKQQEIMDLYKKNNVKPFAAFEQILLTLPIFLIVYRVVTILRPLKATILFNIWNFSYTPLTRIFSNFTQDGWIYIFFLLVVIPIQFISSWLPTRLAKIRNRNATTMSFKGSKESGKRKLFQYAFSGVLSIIVAFTPTGVGVYWFFNALFSILQSYMMHKLIVYKRKKQYKRSIGNVVIS